MSGQFAIAQPSRIKAKHRRRRKIALGPIVQRYYDPAIGRMLSVDPVATRESGDNFNRYNYANNNPYRFTDPDGREAGGGYATGLYTQSGPITNSPEVARLGVAGIATIYGGPLVGRTAVGIIRTAIAIFKGGEAPAPSSRGVDTGELHAPGDVQNSTIIVRGRASEVPATGTVYSGSQGSTVAEAAQGVPHGQIRSTTAGEIRNNGGKVDVLPEPSRGGGPTNGQHVNVVEGGDKSSLGPLTKKADLLK